MRGAYRLADGSIERWSWGEGPLGSRWTSGRNGDDLDLTVATDGTVVRLLARYDGWDVEGSCTDGRVTWTRNGREATAVADGFTGQSPAYAVVVARLLGTGAGRELTLIELTEPVGAPRTVRHRWTRMPEVEPDITSWHVDDLDTGERRRVHLHGELLVAVDGPRTVVLAELQP